MKAHYNRRKNFQLLFLIFCTTNFLISCDHYNFSVPQPVDKNNIYEFPENFRGNWISDDDNEFVFISKNYAALHSIGKEKIVRGVWPVLNDKGDYINPPSYYKSFNTARYDSMKKPIDTVANYLLNGDHIYEVNEEGKLGMGYNYQLDKDTIILLKKEVTSIDLGRNAFLRKLNNDLYVLNILNSILAEDNPWWQLTIIEKKAGGQLNLWDCSGKLKKHPSMFYTTSITKGSGNYYFDPNWTTPDMIRLMQEGYFELSSKLIPDKKAIGKK